MLCSRNLLGIPLRKLGEDVNLEHLKHHYDYIRVDTHESNKTMRRVLTKAGFAYCGVVFYEGYGDMLAYDFVHAAVRPL